MALNAKQKIFVKEYLKSKSATQAAKDAGYSKKTAHSVGPRMLENAGVKKAIADSLNKITEKAELKAADVLAEIRKLAMVDLTEAYDDDGNLLNPKEMAADIRASLQSIETYYEYAGKGREREKIGQTKKVKLYDKVRALEMLAKHFKLLTEVHELIPGSGFKCILTMPSNGTEKPKEEG